MITKTERRQAAIFYAELRNFTRLSEVLPPETVLGLANEFFSICAMSVTARRGKVLSVQNDILIAAFAAANQKEFSGRALEAAQDVQREFAGVGQKWKAEFGLPAAVASAVHLGEAVFGMAGPLGSQQFVAFGDCVSVCERLVHRARSGEAILSEDFLKALGVVPEGIGAQKLPPLQIQNRDPIPIYALVVEDRLDFT